MAPIKTPIVGGMGPQIRSQVLRDFRGGLNFSADGPQFAANEVIDCHDVDLQGNGGFKRRYSFRPLGSTGLGTSAVPKFLYHIPSTGTTGVTLVGGQAGSPAHDKLAVYSVSLTEGIAPTTTLTFTTDSTVGTTWSAAMMARVSAPGTSYVWIHRDYIAPMQRYDTTSGLTTELADSHGAYNDTFTSDGVGSTYNGVPTGNHCPRASIVCAHLDYLFHADTYETATRHPARVRFSHPGEPGDYRTDDFFDVGEGQDSDAITAMVSAYGALFIFKRRSVWMLEGYSADTFSLKRIAYGVGAANKNAACTSQQGIMFWDQMRGVHAISYMHTAGGRMWTVEPQWKNLHVAIENGRFTNEENVCLIWSGTRLYVVGLNDSGADLPNKTYVMDTEVGPGYWQYDVGFDLGRDYVDQFGLHHLMGTSPYRGQTGATQYKDRVNIHAFAPATLPDKYGSASVDYNGSLTHAWIDGGDSSLKKRYRRFSVVFDNMESTHTIAGVAYKNWDPVTQQRTYTIAGNASSFVAGTDINKRSGTVGTAYAVAIKLTGPNDRDWRIGQITHRFIPQRIT